MQAGNVASIEVAGRASSIVTEACWDAGSHP